MNNTTTTKNFIILVIAFLATAFIATLSTVNADTAYTDYDSAGKALLNGINDHKALIEIKYTASSRDGNGIGKAIFKKAINGSAIPDYYDLGIYSRYSMNWTARSNGEGAYNYTFKYDITYMMTKAQSVAFEKKLNKTVASLKLKKKSNAKKVKIIYKWITKHVKYDKKSKGITKYTAFAALNKKKAVCQGYSLLFYRMCLKAGVPANIITGKAHGQAHAWNIVKVGKKYKNCDATWDAGKKAKKYKYYLKSDKKFKKDHKRSATYSTSAFYKSHPMA